MQISLISPVMLGFCLDLTFHLVLLDGDIFFILQQPFLQEGGNIASVVVVQRTFAACARASWSRTGSVLSIPPVIY